MKLGKYFVVNAFLKSQQEIIELNQFQKFICWLFNIKPACKYRQTFDLILPFPYESLGGKHRDILVFTNDTDQWLVIDIASKRIRISNIKPLEDKRTEHGFRGLTGACLSRSFPERQT